MDNPEPATPARADLPAPAPARRVGPYELGRLLGDGPHGKVHEARHVMSGTLVALKLITPSPLDARSRARLGREVRAQSTLEHPGIARLLETGEDGPLTWVAASLVPGTSLRARLAPGPLTAAQALGLVARLASAVAQAHEAGVVHAGLKPENVVLEQGEPRATDFGLSRALGLDSPDTTAALDLAPEQARGALVLVDARTDVWALGAILHEAIAGSPPFDGDDVASLLAAIQQRAPAPLPAREPLERAAATIVLQCLEKDREDRYQEATVLAEDCRRALQGAPLLARRPGSLERIWRTVARRPAPLAGAFVSLLVAFLALVGAHLLEREESASARRALAEAFEQREHDRAEARQREDAAARASRALEGRALRVELESVALSRATPDEARSRAQALAALDPSPATLVAAGEALASVELYPDAAVLFERAAKSPEAAPAALLALASARERQGEDATATYKQLIETATGAAAEDPATLAAQAALEPDAARAVELLTRAVERDRRSARLHLRRALARERAGEPDSALADLEAAQDLAPRLAEPCLERARIRREKGEAAVALGDAERALVLAPRWPQALLERARVRRALGLAREARADVERALGLRPELVAGFVLRGELRSDANDGAGALADLDRALELAPADGGARVARASFRLAHDDPVGALADAEAAVAADPRLPAAWVARGRARARKGDRPGAAADLRKAVNLLGARATRELRDEAAGLEK